MRTSQCSDSECSVDCDYSVDDFCESLSPYFGGGGWTATCVFSGVPTLYTRVSLYDSLDCTGTMVSQSVYELQDSDSCYSASCYRGIVTECTDVSKPNITLVNATWLKFSHFSLLILSVVTIFTTTHSALTKLWGRPATPLAILAIMQLVVLVAHLEIHMDLRLVPFQAQHLLNTVPGRLAIIHTLLWPAVLLAVTLLQQVRRHLSVFSQVQLV